MTACIACPVAFFHLLGLWNAAVTDVRGHLPQCSQPPYTVPRSGMSASPGNWLEMQTLGSFLGPAESETLGAGPELCVPTASRWFQGAEVGEPLPSFLRNLRPICILGFLGLEGRAL